jgi:hypothetical protein
MSPKAMYARSPTVAIVSLVEVEGRSEGKSERRISGYPTTNRHYLPSSGAQRTVAFPSQIGRNYEIFSSSSEAIDTTTEPLS